MNSAADIQEKIQKQLQAYTTTVQPAAKLALRNQLIDYVNMLLVKDFSKLVQLLYQTDVNERLLKQKLAEQQGTDAANVIADMLIERQEQKIRTRTAFKSNDSIPDDEKW